MKCILENVNFNPKHPSPRENLSQTTHTLKKDTNNIGFK